MSPVSAVAAWVRRHPVLCFFVVFAIFPWVVPYKSLGSQVLIYGLFALGFDVGRIWFLVFGIGTGLAGLAGILAGPMRGAYAEMGVTIIIESFVVVVVGGMGSLLGAVISGLLIGQIVGLTTFFAPKLAEIIVFVFMALVLLFRPSGLLGEAGLLE